jgi:hypothetical protein
MFVSNLAMGVLQEAANDCPLRVRVAGLLIFRVVFLVALFVFVHILVPNVAHVYELFFIDLPIGFL